jgi:hypothetical protein
LRFAFGFGADAVPDFDPATACALNAGFAPVVADPFDRGFSSPARFRAILISLPVRLVTTAVCPPWHRAR